MGEFDKVLEDSQFGSSAVSPLTTPQIVSEPKPPGVDFSEADTDPLAVSNSMAVDPKVRMRQRAAEQLKARENPGYKLSPSGIPGSPTDEMHDMLMQESGKIAAARAAGFSDEEIAKWATVDRQKMLSAGFTDKEIDEYFTGIKLHEGVPLPFLQRFFDATTVGKSLKAFGKAFEHEMNPDESDPDSMERLRSLGWATTEEDRANPSILGFGKYIDESIMRTAYGLLKLPQAVISGTGQAIGAGIAGPKATEEQASRIGEEFSALIGIAAVQAGGPEALQVQAQLGAMDSISKPVIDSTGRPHTMEVGKGAPTHEDFMNAAGAVGGKEVPPYVANKLVDLYNVEGLHPSEVAHEALTDPVAKQELLSVTPVKSRLKYVARQPDGVNVQVSREFDVPYGAGTSKDGTTVYVDRRVPRSFTDPSRAVYDPAVFVARHEAIEHAVIMDNQEALRATLGDQAQPLIDKMKEVKKNETKIPYHEAHLEFANVAEKMLVERAGLNWPAYQEQWKHWLQITEHEVADEPPPDLYEKPYPHDEQVLLKEAGREPTAVSEPDHSESESTISIPSKEVIPEESVEQRVPLEIPESTRAEAQRLDELAPMRDEIRAQPGANTGRLAKLLGPKLYGEPTHLARVSVKEMFQNAFDAIKGSIEKGQLQKGRIDIDMDKQSRRIVVTDNGSGMAPEVLAKQFLEIAGTSKETTQASGGLGIAKMLFLFGNKEIHVTTLRDGVVSHLDTTGEQLFRALEDHTQAPNIQTEKRGFLGLKYKNQFPDGHGTRVEITVPEEYKDTSTGEMKKIEFQDQSYQHEVLNKSPLFHDIDVHFNGQKQYHLGSEFPRDNYSQFANINFDWGTARIYVSKNSSGSYGENSHVLSNGLWQFGTSIKKNPKEPYGDNVPREFYIDVSTKVRPEDPGYPFDLNRQGFAKQAGDDFKKIFNHISALYRYSDFSKESKSFGTFEYLTKEGNKVVSSGQQELRPETPERITAASAINEGDKIEVKDGKLIVNNRVIPELTKEDLNDSHIDVDELKIPQEKIDPNKVMLHDNVDVSLPYKDENGFELSGETTSIVAAARKKFGDRFDNLAHAIGQTFIDLRNLVSQVMGSEDKAYKELMDEAIGLSFDPEYRGVSIRVPFRGSFLNIAGPEYKDPIRAGYGMVGTMIHELAHFKVRSHDANFPAEMQRITLNLKAFHNQELANLEAGVVEAILAHEDVFKFLHEALNDSGTTTRGSRFKTGSYQARDGGNNPELGGPGKPEDRTADLPARIGRELSGAEEGREPKGVAGGGGGRGGPPGGPTIEGSLGGDADRPLDVVTVERGKAAGDRISKAISVGERPAEKKLGFNRLYENLFDQLYGVSVGIKNATGKAAASQNFNEKLTGYELLRLMAGSAGRVNHWIRYGTIDFHSYRTNGPGLKQILSPYLSHGKMNEVRKAIAATTALELDARGVRYAVKAEDARDFLRANRDLASVVHSLREYNDKLVDYAYDSGILTDNGREALRGLNTTFAAYNDVMVLPGRAHLKTKLPNDPVKRISSIHTRVIDPIETLVKNTYLMTTVADRNEALTTLLDVLRVPKDLESNLPAVIAPRDIAPTAGDRTSLAIRGMFDQARAPVDDATVDVLHHLAHPDDVDQGQLSIFKNGIRETYDVDPDIAQSVHNLDRQMSSFIARALGTMTRTSRAGIVFSPSFWMRHLLREPFYAAMTYQPGIFTPVDMFRGFTGMLLHNLGVHEEAYTEFLKGGGAHSSIVALDRNYMQEDLAALNAKTGFWNTAFNSVGNPLVAGRMVLEATLAASHFGAFIKARDKMKRLGMEDQYSRIPEGELNDLKNQYLQRLGTKISPDEALQFAADDLKEKYPPAPSKQQIQRAAFISRDTSVDNARIGAATKGMNTVSKFFNNTLQDSDRIVRAFKDNPIKTGFVIAAGIILPSMMLWYAFHDDRRYQDAKKQRKDTNWIIPIPGRPFAFNSPKPFGAGALFGTGAEDLLQSIYDQNPKALSGLAEAMMESMVPNFIPDAAVPIIEQMTNKSQFTGASIVPHYAEKYLPEYQYTQYTSELAKSLGRALGPLPIIKDQKMGGIAEGPVRALITPALLENYINAITGTVGSFLFKTTDFALRKAGVVPDPVVPAKSISDNIFVRSFVRKYPEAGTQPISDFYETYNRNKAFYDTWRDRVQHGDPIATSIMNQAGGAVMFLQLDKIHQALGVTARLIRDTTEMPGMSATDKRQLIDKYYLIMVESAKVGNQLLKSAEEHSGYLH